MSGKDTTKTKSTRYYTNINEEENNESDVRG